MTRKAPQRPSPEIVVRELFHLLYANDDQVGHGHPTGTGAHSEVAFALSFPNSKQTVNILRLTEPIHPSSSVRSFVCISYHLDDSQQNTDLTVWHDDDEDDRNDSRLLPGDRYCWLRRLFHGIFRASFAESDLE